jgi:threonine dehydrogenase-like Zn-dependent dehydrogenase
MMKAKAAVLIADRTFDFRELPVPDAPPQGGALLRVEGCGMCGSDIEQYKGGTAKAGIGAFPVIPGHEILGRIQSLDAAGARRWDLAEGDRVAVHGLAPCGVCPPCMRGAKCVDAFYYGFRSLSDGSGLWGGYGNYMEIAPRTKLYRIADDLSVEDALLFNPFAAGFDWVLRLGRLQVGQSVLILGGGQRGLASVLAAKDAGASQIIVTGLRRDAFKLEIARQFGATHSLIAEETDVAEAIAELTAGRGVDLVVDTTPNAFQPVTDAIKAVRHGGRIVLGGIKGHKDMPAFPVDELLMKQIEMIGALSSSHWGVQQAIRLVEERRYPVHLMHTHSVPIQDVEKAIQTLAGEIPDDPALHISIIHTH